MNRRRFIRHAMLALASAQATKSTFALASAEPPLAANLDNHLETYLDTQHQATLPIGASLRIIAHSGQPALPAATYRWHGAPDGGACFATPDQGWVYVCNSELPDRQGGVGALRFNPQGELIDSYPILQNTTRNCAGGPSLWNTWLSCEENDDQGQVYECDPLGQLPARVLPALGSFNHEAVAMDPHTGQAYLTEDKPDGCLYRFTPTQTGNLQHGVLEVAIADGQRLSWSPVPDPGAQRSPTRLQVENATRFRGGEGIVYHQGHIFFTTKIDNRVWSLHLQTQQLTVVYDAEHYTDPLLTGVDNITITPNGQLLVAEDGGNMQLVALLNNHRTPLALVTLHNQSRSEITGPAFSPDGRKLYFNSQRGSSGRSEDGITYELTLPEGLWFRDGLQ